MRTWYYNVVVKRFINQDIVEGSIIRSGIKRGAKGETNLPKIKVDDDIIVDGKHRYITSRITGIDVDIQDWIGGNHDIIINWNDV